MMTCYGIHMDMVQAHLVVHYTISDKAQLVSIPSVIVSCDYIKDINDVLPWCGGLLV